jgi:hypothetical protein
MASAGLRRALSKFRSKPSKGSTSSWANDRGNGESDGGLAMWVPNSSLSALRCRLAKRSMPRSKPWPLRMARIATNSIHHCGNRTPRRLRQSGNALRKGIRSVAGEAFSRGVARDEKHDLACKLMTQTAHQDYWDKLLMGPWDERSDGGWACQPVRF